MDILWKIGSFAIVLGVLVTFHELGHYVVARLAGVKVLRFSIGFGRVLWSRALGRDRTEWAVSAIPLGGYVKMVDEREADVEPADLPRAFNRQPVWKRIAIVAAGPMANLLLAVLLFAAAFMAGVPAQKAMLAPPLAGTAAAAAGVQADERVTAVDGHAVKSWQELRWQLAKAQGDAFVTLAVARKDGSTVERRRRSAAWRRKPGKATRWGRWACASTSGRRRWARPWPACRPRARDWPRGTTSSRSKARRSVRPPMRRSSPPRIRANRSA